MPARAAIACQLRISAAVYGSAAHHGQWMASERTSAGWRTAICCAIMPAHRGADDVRPLDPEVAEQGDGDVGEERGRVGAAGPLRLADSRVVEDDDAERLLQVLGLERPRRVVGAEPVDEQHRVAGAVLLVEDAALAELSVRHREASACGGSGARAVVHVVHVAHEVDDGACAPTRGTPRPSRPSTRSVAPHAAAVLEQRPERPGVARNNGSSSASAFVRSSGSEA